jgi:hypothetical protein
MLLERGKSIWKQRTFTGIGIRFTSILFHAHSYGPVQRRIALSPYFVCSEEATTFTGKYLSTYRPRRVLVLTPHP